MAPTGDYRPLFLSLGKTVADEPHLPSRRAYHSVGGPGMYSSLGARLAVRKDRKHRVAYVLLSKCDNFAKCGERQLGEWDISFEIYPGGDLETASGQPWSHSPEYHKLVGPIEDLQPYPHHLPSFFLEAQSFYFYGSPEQACRQEGELFYLRRKHQIKGRPLILWEPSPEVCTSEHFKTILAVSELADVFSPSHEDLLALLGHCTDSPFEPQFIEQCADVFLAENLEVPTNSKDIKFCIVRAGIHGTLLCQQTRDGIISKNWIPAFYSVDDQDQIFDARGSGSTFLGAFAVEYLQKGGNATEAAIKASVCASFAVEQDGLPNHNRGITREAWNGATVAERSLEYHRKYEVPADDSFDLRRLHSLPVGLQGTE